MKYDVNVHIVGNLRVSSKLAGFTNTVTSILDARNTDIGLAVQKMQDTQVTAFAGFPEKSQTFKKSHISGIMIPNLTHCSGRSVWRDAVRQWEQGDPDKGLPALKNWPKEWYSGEMRRYEPKRRTRQVIAEEYERSALVNFHRWLTTDSYFYSLDRDDAKFEMAYAGEDTLTSLVNAIRRNEENRAKFAFRKSGSPNE